MPTCRFFLALHSAFGARDAGWKYPVDGVWKRWWPVTAQALAKVDVIRDQALALGWSQAQPHHYACGHSSARCVSTTGAWINHG